MRQGAYCLLYSVESYDMLACFPRVLRSKQTFFEKSWGNVWWVREKCVPLHSQFRNKGCNQIGVWCNGNTTDSGPVILGSSPSTPTGKAEQFKTAWLFSCTKVSYSNVYH